MTKLTLHPMKELRIIVQGENLKYVTDMLIDIDTSGYTIFDNISGKGHHGVHASRSGGLYNEMEGLVMVLSVVPEEKVDPILSGLAPIFGKNTGVVFVSDVSVSRKEYFDKK